MQQPMFNPEDISDPITAINMTLVLMAKALKHNYSTPTNINQRISSNPRNRQIAQPGMNLGQDRHMQMIGGNGGKKFRHYVGKNIGNQNGYNAVQNNVNQNGNGNVVAARAKGNGNGNRNNGNQVRCYNCREMGHLARNRIVRPRRRDDAYLQTQLLIAQKEEAGIQLQAEEFDLMAAAVDLDEIEEVNANCILMARLTKLQSMTQMDQLKEQYTELLKPIPKPHQVQQNDSNVISEVSSVEQSGGTVDQHPAIVEEARAYFESLYNNLATKVEKVNTFLKEKSTVSSLLEEKKKLKSDFKTRQDELLDKQIQLENKINELDNILVKIENGFGLSKSFYLKQAQQKQQSLYNGKVLLEKHDPPAVYDSKETLQLAQEKAAKFVRDFKSLAKEADESLAKHKALDLEIERLLREVVSQDIMSIVQSNSVVDTSNLQTELERTKEHFENSYNDMQQKIERLQAQLGDLKGKCKDTPRVSDTLDPLSQKLENENIELETLEQKFTTKGTSVNTQFRKQSILGKPPSSSGSKLYSVTPFPKSKVYNTAKTRRPQLRSNTKNDRVPSASKSSYKKHKEVEVKEHPRNLLLFYRMKKTSPSECHNIKRAIQNDKSEVVCAMCKQCLITANHDVGVLNYVNGMNVVSKLRSNALACKVIVTLDISKLTMRETLLRCFTKGYAESNL
ncbi:retrovirus-related pol polyprotein from transposon TNT 1-94 [Tanacetum coccineum]|uniref:Retrovirus-related pol polyprotein from transposon TNT 1-94 n=1 Tax=Tanacetum coccineum TaxID=301880 RepID=A0ABQ5JE24_9ASTR